MINQKYILEGKKLVPVDLMTWARWFDTANRYVAKDVIGKVTVSTVFWGMDYNFGSGKPLLFETMIFGGKHDEYQKRYSTWEEAEKGHKKALKLITPSKGE